MQDNGKQLACVDASDDDYHLSVWDWEERAIMQQSKVISTMVIKISNIFSLQLSRLLAGFMFCSLGGRHNLTQVLNNNI